MRRYGRAIFAFIIFYVVSVLSITAGLSVVGAYTGGNPYTMWYGAAGFRLDEKNVISLVIAAVNTPVYNYLYKKVGGGFAEIIVLTIVCLESIVFGLSCGMQLLM